MKSRTFRNLVVGWLVMISSVPLLGDGLPEGFVYLGDEVPGVEIELRYWTGDNFVGARVDGYLKPRCVLTKQAAEALARVQEGLERFGLGLKVFDAYRPQSAVDHFVRWAKDLSDSATKEEFYPGVAKKDLFKEGYIAEKSSHTRGSTVDVTIVDLESKKELDMGSLHDFFGTISWPSDPRPTEVQRAHRMLLQMVMGAEGFNHYEQEWWHFTLKDEPFPDTYFDFPIR